MIVTLRFDFFLLKRQNVTILKLGIRTPHDFTKYADSGTDILDIQCFSNKTILHSLVLI